MRSDIVKTWQFGGFSPIWKCPLLKLLLYAHLYQISFRLVLLALDRKVYHQ